MSGQHLVGALIGWKRQPSEHGMIISFQLLAPEASVEKRESDRVSLALNDRQLRSLARDLQRAADERGIKLWASSKWRRFLPK